MPYILGLTGNIASGKTTIGLMLLNLGAQVYVDADRVVHELYLPGQPLVAELTRIFGPQIIDEAGGVDRQVLGRIVFSDPARLRLLESIVHPAVQTALLASLRQLAEMGPDAVGVLDAVKLVESGNAQLGHALWLVTCSPEIQLKRLTELRGMSEEDARLRLAAQPELESKYATATEIIDNSSNLPQLQAQVTAAWGRFMAHIRVVGV